ncbi:ABC transporter substrate-binding protein [Allorhizocola rhizosphaerae]|uniref:ABC transporter substrate-binding protein n=1 Tax=Allorhizocola rhizosphaerae TaxID=1872709 RepID=UPI001FE8E114|nr:sugar ABC transporter substrate-binding protein [Allorhizocola rhizosphaerae]
MTRKLIAALAVLALLGGCSTGTAGANEPVKLMVFGSPDELAAYRTLMQAYKDKTGKSVQLVEASDRKDLITRLSTSIAGGEPPDLFLMNYRFYGQFAAKNALEPLADRLTASSVIKAGDYYPVAMEAFQWQGRQLCLPQNVSSLVVYYNKTLFAKYGVPEPKPGWTWTDFLGTALLLTRDAAGNPVRTSGESEGAPAKASVYGVGIEPSIIRLAPFAWSNGGEILDSEQKPTRFTLDSPAALEALKNLVDLRLAYGVTPTDQEVEAEADEARFANWRLGMLLSSRRSTTALRKVKDFEWDVAALPVYKKPAGILHSDAYCMTKGSKNKDAAWRFIEYAMSAEGQKMFTATGRTVPSHIEASKSDAFLDGKTPKNAQVFLDGIPTIRRVPTISTWPEIEDVTYGILENAMFRGDRLDTVIADIDKQTRPIFARAQQ